mmetsp:Transcript_37504/g.105901  ORF Transcript_37504/g.105901 Transcript_37504/m.105901 type:complete len:142 (-) Transcript_37504:189-614(-)
MLTFMDTCTADISKAINMAICTFIVCCGLPFAIVENVYFINLLRVLRPAFITHHLLMSRKWFSEIALEALHEDVKKKMVSAFEARAASPYYTLAGDGFKTESSEKVVNFAEQRQPTVAFKDSTAVAEQHEDADMYILKFKK